MLSGVLGASAFPRSLGGQKFSRCIWISVSVRTDLSQPRAVSLGCPLDRRPTPHCSSSPFPWPLLSLVPLPSQGLSLAGAPGPPCRVPCPQPTHFWVPKFQPPTASRVFRAGFLAETRHTNDSLCHPPGLLGALWGGEGLGVRPPKTLGNPLWAL